MLTTQITTQRATIDEVSIRYADSDHLRPTPHRLVATPLMASRVITRERNWGDGRDAERESMA
jgi:hypothetical protein